MNGAHGLISQIGVGLPTTHPAEMAGQPSVERQAALVKRKSAQAGGQDLRGQGRKRDEAFLPYAVGAIHELPLRLTHSLPVPIPVPSRLVPMQEGLWLVQSVYYLLSEHSTIVQRMLPL